VAHVLLRPIPGEFLQVLPVGRGVGSVCRVAVREGEAYFRDLPFQLAAWWEANFEALLRGGPTLICKIAPVLERLWSFPDQELRWLVRELAGIDALAWIIPAHTTPVHAQQDLCKLVANSNTGLGLLEGLAFLAGPATKLAALRIIPQVFRTRTSPSELSSPVRITAPFVPNRVVRAPSGLHLPQEVNGNHAKRAIQPDYPGCLNLHLELTRWDSPKRGLALCGDSWISAMPTSYPLQHVGDCSANY